MSVINKMLRDLDQRQVPDDSGTIQPGATPLRSGTASVPRMRVPPKPLRSSPLAALVPLSIAAAALAVCGGAAWWWLHKAPPETTPMVAVQVAPPNTAANTTALLTIAAQPALTASTPAVVQTHAKVPQSTASVSTPLPVVIPSPPPSPPPPPATNSVAQAPVHTPSPSPTPTPTPMIVSAASVAAPPKPVAPDAASTGQRQQQAAREAQAQAQTLWNSGAHDNAIDLLQQAVATAERSAQGAPGAPATQALASLARELARMQLAQGRPGATVDMLARLEPLLSGEPDIWAVRANAAQRAGRHQDSVNAYTTALQSRPNEQRWLLGAAVSSAALGQTANATALAQKAAAVGPVPKDVQAYLRQSGVAIGTD